MRFRTLVALPFVAFSLVGCGSGSASGTGGTVPANATLIKALDGITWDAKTYTASAVAGSVTIAVENESSSPHNLHLLDSNNVDVGIALDVDGHGDVKSGSAKLAPGTYKVICTIAGHGNMKATLTVG
jgi:plastocyanin